MSVIAAPVRISAASAYPAAAARLSVQGLVAVVVLHVGVLGVLASLDVLPLPQPLATLMVQVIAPTTPPAPDIRPARPQPVQSRPVVRPQQAPLRQTLAAPTAAPGAVAEVPLVTPAPAPPVEPAPAPAPAAPVTPTPTPTPTPIITPARFDADYLQNPAPAYPALSRRLGEEGRVVLRVFVEASGHPGQIEVRTGSGSPRLDQAAQDAVWRWQFVPARRGPEAVGAWVLVPLIFNLRG